MRYKFGQTVNINGVAGVIRRIGSFIDADTVRHNPAFDPNYESEQGRYNGPVWVPFEEGAEVHGLQDARADNESKNDGK